MFIKISYCTLDQALQSADHQSWSSVVKYNYEQYFIIVIE